MSMSTRGAGRDDDDARFADIVARWDDPPPEVIDRPAPSPSRREPRPEPVVEPLDEPVAERVVEQAPEPRTFEEPTPWRLHEPPEDEDEGFEPSPPRPLPSFYDDWPFYLALVGLVGGPLWLVFLAVFASTEHTKMLMAGVLTVAGFVTLVLRQPRERDVDDDDDGARV